MHATFAALPPSARIYVVVVCAVAAAVLFTSVTGVRATPPAALSALMLLSLLASVVKVEIPISGNVSTLTACHVIDLITLIMYGANAAVLVAAWGGWTQCTFRSRVRNPPHQTAFSVASLAVATWSAGIVLAGMKVRTADASMLQWESLAAAATVLFLLNSGLVAGAVALTSSQPLLNAWSFFFASWPSYVIGAVLAAAIVTGIEHQSYWLTPLLAAALALIHRNHQSVVERINDAMIDPLTGLHNQRFVAGYVERELARSRRSRECVAIAVLDLDDFKQINDRGGHATGDAVLRRVAQALTRVVRDSDICARHGGDEFVVVMPGCGAVEARRRIDEIQRAVASAGFDAPHTLATLGISAGVAVFPDDGDCFEELFAAADSRMYQSKRTPRPSWPPTNNA
jgi:diguanylate cyclase (GGDEF)-like protein